MISNKWECFDRCSFIKIQLIILEKGISGCICEFYNELFKVTNPNLIKVKKC